MSDYISIKFCISINKIPKIHIHYRMNNNLTLKEKREENAFSWVGDGR